jgi:hypothetical protein
LLNKSGMFQLAWSLTVLFTLPFLLGRPVLGIAQLATGQEHVLSSERRRSCRSMARAVSAARPAWSVCIDSTYSSGKQKKAVVLLAAPKYPALYVCVCSLVCSITHAFIFLVSGDWTNSGAGWINGAVEEDEQGKRGRKIETGGFVQKVGSRLLIAVHFRGM